MSKRSRYMGLPTEAVHPRAATLDRLSIEQLVHLLLADEVYAQRAAQAVSKDVARAAGIIVAALAAGGRLFYVGAGTSGRLGALDAAELPPTFGSSKKQVTAILAGGNAAMLRSVEGAEDRGEEAERALKKAKLSARDVVCAIAASGMTTFSRTALLYAERLGAKRIFVTCVKRAAFKKLADVVIAAEVGPELLAGSTRLKAGTATKIILNALSTATMVRLGHVHKGRMVDVVASNIKLRHRALGIVRDLTGLDEIAAIALLTRANFQPKLAIAMHTLDATPKRARTALAAHDAHLDRLIAATKTNTRRAKNDRRSSDRRKA